MMRLVVGFLSVFVASAAWADESWQSPTLKACLARAQTTVDLVMCFNAGLAEADQALNANYRAALASLPSDQQAKLRGAQRAWLAFRKQDCDVFYGQGTGTFASIAAGACMVRHTIVRAQDLKQLAQTP